MTETAEKVDHDTLVQALIAAQAEFDAIAKDTKNEFFKSKYADLAAVREATQPILAKHGLGVTQKPGYLVVEGDKVYDTLVTKLIHENGEFDESEMILRPVKQDPQGQGSAITYARRYAYQAVLGLVTDDDDGQAASTPARQPKAPDEIQLALDAVMAAVKAAGVAPADATGWFKETYSEASLLKSRNLKALKEAAEHFGVIGAEKAVSE